MAVEPYVVELSRRARRGRESLPKRKRLIVDAFIESHLRSTPLSRIPGRTKHLKGEMQGYLQYDVDDRLRLIYRVDSESRTVYVHHIGPHPKW